MWGRSLVMLLVLLAILVVAVGWLIDRSTLSPLDAHAAGPKDSPPPPSALAEAGLLPGAPTARSNVNREPVEPNSPESVSPQHPGTLSAAEIESAIADLHDDDIPGNAQRAYHALLNERTAQPALRRALRSADQQQRQIAALILRRQDAAPDPDLLKVSLEALDHRVDRTMSAAISGSVARSVLPYLYHHPESCITQARARLWRDSRREKLLGAFLLACAQDTEHLGTVVHILSSHLEDNRISGDALLATHGLYRLGEAGRPMLEDMRRYADEQGYQLLNLILENLRNPPTTPEELRSRSTMHRVTSVYHDPAVEYVVGRTSVLGL